MQIMHDLCMEFVTVPIKADYVIFRLPKRKKKFKSPILKVIRKHVTVYISNEDDGADEKK